MSVVNPKLNHEERRAIRLAGMGHTAEGVRTSWRAVKRQGCGCVGLCRHVVEGKGIQSLIGVTIVKDNDGYGIKKVYRITRRTTTTNTQPFQ